MPVRRSIGMTCTEWNSDGYKLNPSPTPVSSPAPSDAYVVSLHWPRSAATTLTGLCTLRVKAILSPGLILLPAENFNSALLDPEPLHVEVRE